MQVPEDNRRLIPHDVIDRLESEWRQVRVDLRAERFTAPQSQPAGRPDQHPQTDGGGR